MKERKVSQQQDHTKQHGIHYTPPELAGFLARVTYAAVETKRGKLDVLDPACGDGVLLYALAQAVPKRRRKRLNLFGFEQDHKAAEDARRSLASLEVNSVNIQERDFLDVDGVQFGNGQRQLNFFDAESSPIAKYDVVIANPPYVRTQVLGAKRAQALGKKFGLTGRVDLYHAFSIAMANVLREGGVLGLLTSNRFLTIKSGLSLRRYLRNHFQLRSVFDLGDTKLFKAAVLPVIVVAQECVNPNASVECQFSRVYEHRSNGRTVADAQQFDHVLDAVEQSEFAGLAQTETGLLYDVEKGTLFSSGEGEVWSLSTPENTQWLTTIHRHRKYTFDDISQIRVGIKTTADAVFIREDWQSLPKENRPERKLIHPLITHHNAERWVVADGNHRKSVLYPHESHNGKRSPISLQRYPKAASYLNTHAERLRARKYVVDGGRQWFEIWVPHDPNDWKKKKVVFLDISERPTFFLDESDAIVNGDCYWITLKPGFADDWLYLILAVANSSFITRYYDVTFHNKLYAGRRRFMTQYVKQFPLPKLATPTSRAIVREVKKLFKTDELKKRDRLEKRIESLVWQSFGLVEEISG